MRRDEFGNTFGIFAEICEEWGSLYAKERFILGGKEVQQLQRTL